MLAFCAALSVRSGLASDTLTRVRRLEHLVCGVVSEPADWNKDDLHGDLSPFATRICVALAANLAAGSTAVSIQRAASEGEALEALAAGQTNVVMGVTPGPAAAAKGAVTGPVIFRDNLVFAVRPASGIGSIAALDRRTLCFIDGTAIADLALETLSEQGIRPIPFPFQEQGEMDAAVSGGRCEAVAASESRLAEFREQFGHLDFLTPPFGMVPATVATRQGDAAWTAEVAKAVTAVLRHSETGACALSRASHSATRPRPPSPCH